VLDSLVRGEQPEREQHRPSFHAELVLVVVRIDERYVRNAVRDEIDLGRRRLVHLLQHQPSALGHDHEARRARDQLVHHAPLVGVRIAEDRVERRDDRHSQLAQQRQQMAAGGPSVDPNSCCTQTMSTLAMLRKSAAR